MLCGLLTPDSGEGTCLGLRRAARERRHQAAGRLHDAAFSLWEDLSIRENLDFVARMFGMKHRREAVDQALEELGLTGGATSSPARSRAAGSSAWRWPPACCTSPGCCCSTSPPPASTPRRGATSGKRSTAWRPPASPCWCPPTTWTRPSAATAWPTSPTARLLASGTAAEIVAGQRLHTWEISGNGLHGLSPALRALPGVDLVATFGATLHVSGRDGEQAGSGPACRISWPTPSWPWRRWCPRWRTPSST
jgi:ABC-2 type transport system ATP-binding protein